MEAHAISCILPLLALLLLAIQLLRHSGQYKSLQAVTHTTTPEFPCHMGGLISISDECERNYHKHIPCTL